MPKVSRCPTCHRRLTRNNDQNRRLWALYHQISERVRVPAFDDDGNVLPGTQTYSAEVWHTWAKSKFLGCDEFKLPSGKSMLIPRSTAALEVDKFADYMTQVEAWANEHGVFLADDEARMA